jgi:hypothetical protein
VFEHVIAALVHGSGYERLQAGEALARGALPLLDNRLRQTPPVH